MKNKLQRFASRVFERSIDNLSYGITDVRARLSQGDSMVPPESMVFVGTGDFVAVGEEFKRHFIELCDLQPDQHVLDVGCGIGRMAIPLTGYLSSKGGYAGIDIVRKGIRWCNSRIAKRHSNFRFIHSDIYNRTYNRHGRVQANGYRFPFEDASFDLVFLTSVFTHMLPGDVAHYLDEIARVLRPGGRVLATFFLHNASSSAQLQAGKADIAFVPTPGGYWVVHPDRPEDAVAYDEEQALAGIRRVGLEMAPPIRYGSWSGRADFLSYQDIVIARKPHR